MEMVELGEEVFGVLFQHSHECCCICIHL